MRVIKYVLLSVLAVGLPTELLLRPRLPTSRAEAILRFIFATFVAFTIPALFALEAYEVRRRKTIKDDQ